MFLNYEAFLTEPGTVDEMKCFVCGSVCNVERNCYGYTSWGGAMAKRKVMHDKFVCPHMGERWHEKALELCRYIKESPSESVNEFIQKDLDKLLEENIGQEARINKYLNKIKSRYFRPVMAHPEGHIVHDGDCYIYSSGICTCGLFHMLLPAPTEVLEMFIEEFDEQLQIHFAKLEEAKNIEIDKNRFLTLEEADKLIEELFNKNKAEDIDRLDI